MDSISRPAAAVVVVVARELWGQPDNTPHRNGTDDRGCTTVLFGPTASSGSIAWSNPTKTIDRRRKLRAIGQLPMPIERSICQLGPG